MAQKNISELKKEIVQKNTMLNSLRTDANRDRETIKSVKIELDSLLYQYYKLYKCG